MLKKIISVFLVVFAFASFSVTAMAIDDPSLEKSIIIEDEVTPDSVNASTFRFYGLRDPIPGRMWHTVTQGGVTYAGYLPRTSITNVYGPPNNTHSGYRVVFSGKLTAIW